MKVHVLRQVAADLTGLQREQAREHEGVSEQPAESFGSPRGLENSVTMGTVSARARQLQSEAPMIYIQTDATINPGNSGGPLVDSQGRVVGINTLIFSRSGGSEGIGFAAPSNIVRSVFEQIRDTGRVRRGVIGVHAQTLTPALAAGLGTPRDWGASLGEVTPGPPADRVGRRPGDIVLSLDGKLMENGRQLTVNLYNKPIGGRVHLEVLRGEEELSFEVAVVERSDDPSRFVDFVDPERNLQPLGILCLELAERVAVCSQRPASRRESSWRRALLGHLTGRVASNPATSCTR